MITSKNVKDYIQGNFRYYLNKIAIMPDYLKEQVDYRLSICEKDCLPENKCRNCTCPPIKKAWSDSSCNLERFPDLMDKPTWEKYKEEHGI